MPWGVAAAAGASIIGSAISGGGASTSSGTQATSNTSAPTSFNKPYISQQFQGAQNLLNQQQATGAPTGDVIAQATQGQQDAAQQATDFGLGNGIGLVNSGASSLSNLYGNAGSYSANASNLAANGTAAANSGDMNTLNSYGNGTQTASLVNSGLSSALNNSATAGTSAINNALGTLGSNSQTALQDPTQQINNDASTYMNNSALQAQEASVNAGISNTLNETTLPGINQAAAMGGSLNSSRAGAANAEAQGQAALAMGSADSSLANNAYNTGVSTAANTYENGLSASNSAAASAANAGLGTAGTVANLQNNEGQFNATTQLGAANSGISQQLASEGLNANTQLTANAQLGQGIFDAALGTGNVMNAATTDQNLSAAAGTQQQAAAQAADTNALDKANNTVTYNDNAMTQYANTVDNPSYSTTNGTGNSSSTTPGAGYVGTALGTFAGLNGLTGNSDGSGTLLGNAISGLGSSSGSTVAGAASAASSSAASDNFLASMFT